jgi:hypothetical protein
MLLNGKADEMLYHDRAIVTAGLPFAELKSRSLINRRAGAADKDSDFSRAIRQDLPRKLAVPLSVPFTLCGRLTQVLVHLFGVVLRQIVFEHPLSDF